MRIHQHNFLHVVSAIILCASLASCTSPSGSKSRATANIPWDWTGVIGTGQSLSIGARSKGISTNQPYGNLKLTTDSLPWPIDPNDPKIALAPLVEPIGRLAPRFPSSWPENITGETPQTAMANEVSALVKADFGRDYVTVQSAVGEDGQGIQFLKKNPTQRGLNGHSFEAAMVETKAITRLAKAAGKTYGVAAITVTHGESDAGNRSYEEQLYQLLQDYNTDIAAITGQKQKIQMLVSQQHSSGGDRAPSTMAEWKIGVDHPTEIVCSGPKYQYPYFTDGVHLTAQGYQQLGEKYGQVYFERVVLGNDWQPLQPTSVDRNGKVITVHLHVPKPPLVWETSFQTPHQSNETWKEGKGFEITTSSGEKVTISSAKISGDTVVITCATDPGANARVSYAMYGDGRNVKMMSPFAGTSRWGQLRDSDPLVGSSSKTPQPNYCVAFEMTAP